jgi:hypothetical protein
LWFVVGIHADGEPSCRAMILVSWRVSVDVKLSPASICTVCLLG